MVLVEPVPDHPAATAVLDDERLLLVADYHAGIEEALRMERGVELDSAAPERREHLLSLVDRTDATRVVVLGDLMHSIGGPGGAERGEVEVLAESLDVPLTLVKGNHDGAIESWLPDVTVTAGGGTRIGPLGLVHGHTWPSPAVLDAEVVCMGHEHPCVRLEDSVGGSRVERVWLRGTLARNPFANEVTAADWDAPELVVFPSFNERTGGTWTNVSGQGFLAPYLPDALPDGEAYLLDGTRLGRYDAI